MKKKVQEWAQLFYDGYKNKYAEWLIVIWMIVPLFMGIINYTMIKKTNYDAYTYLDCWRIVVACVLLCVLLVTIIFMVSLYFFKGLGIKGVLIKICNDEKWMLFWIALSIWSLICVGTSVDVSNAFFGEFYMAEGYMGYLFGIAIIICSSFITSKEERVKILTLFCAITDILSFVMLEYEFAVPFGKKFSAYTGLSVYTNSNHFGYILAMAILCTAGMFFMYLQKDSVDDERKRKAYCAFFGVSFFLNVYAMMYNDTLGVYLAVVIGLIVIMIFWKVRIGKLSAAYYLPLLCVALFTAMSFIGLLTNQIDGSIAKSLIGMWKDILKMKSHSEGYQKAGTNRIGLWKDAIKAIAKRPILGYGPGVRYDSEWNEIIRTQPHNEYLECALFLGIPGAIMYIGGLLSLCIDRCKKLKTIDYIDLVAAGALIGYLISAVVGARRFHTSPYMFVFVGLLINWKPIATTNKMEQTDTHNL